MSFKYGGQAKMVGCGVVGIVTDGTLVIMGVVVNVMVGVGLTGMDVDGVGSVGVTERLTDGTTDGITQFVIDVTLLRHLSSMAITSQR